MIPIKSKNFDDNLNITTMPSATFKINFEKNRLSQPLDQTDSLVQAVYKILMTKRYSHSIYNWDYGIELDDLFGMPLGYIKAELERRIPDALSIDDRIEKVYNFQIAKLQEKGSLLISFNIKSIFGDTKLEWEMKT